MTNSEVCGKRTVDANVAKLAPCLKSDPIDCKYGLKNGIPRACAAFFPTQIVTENLLNQNFAFHFNSIGEKIESSLCHLVSLYLYKLLKCAENVQIHSSWIFLDYVQEISTLASYDVLSLNSDFLYHS